MLAGSLIDPRPAYAVADIVIGMGGSALRGMAFGKPVVIVGAKGFAAVFGPETAESFYYKGMYGVGDGGANNACLVDAIRELAERPAWRESVGEFARQFVVERF